MFFKRAKAPVVLCSFCGKSVEAAKRMVEGPGVHICDTCVGACARLVAGDERHTEPGQRSGACLRLLDSGKSKA